MEKRKKTFIYIAADFLSAFSAWLIFISLRVKFVHGGTNTDFIFFDPGVKYFSALIGIPLSWTVLYAILGSYRNVFRKSRLKEFLMTFVVSLIGNIVIFFVLVLDDYVFNYTNYYQLFLILFSSHFILTAMCRSLITHRIKKQIETGRSGFKTLFAGSGQAALDLYKSLSSETSNGFHFIGFVGADGMQNSDLSKYLVAKGTFLDLPQIIKKENIEELLIALEPEEYSRAGGLIRAAETFDELEIKVIPQMFNVFPGKLSVAFFLETPLLVYKRQPISETEKQIKRIFDIACSAGAVLALLPVYLIAGIGIKLSSKGPMLYRQERIGLHEKPFKIIKFRTMKIDAEKNGPQLSSDNDSRVTRFGRFLRKYRIDEIPQFFNVLKGDMSIVGPRPERRFYIDQILKYEPNYTKLLSVRPGITSWGNVKYGYSENLNQMLERLKYDFYYIDNMSFYLDMKIMLYTVGVVLKSEGK